ncbi:sugar ABC transporter substrate-binding protein [Streptomyces iranensis]|uniref:sugar ABC transporter substrate-binding protein n=1 Tax=Streptomyces iranensis TaxID=576784 RepID=UPI0039B78EA9
MNRLLSRRGAIAATAALLFIGTAACGTGSRSGKQLTIGFAAPVLANSYWKANADFARRMGAQLGVKVIVADAQEREDTQLKNVQDLIAQGADGIVFGPTTAEIGPALLRACRRAGVVCGAAARKPGIEPSGESDSYYAGYVVGNDTGDGAAGAESLSDAGCKKVVAMSGLQGNSTADARLNGFTKKARDRGLTILGTPQRPVELPESGLKATQNFLAKFPGPRFDCLWAFNDGSAIGAIRALSAAGAQKVKVASIDGTAEGVEAIKSGRMLVSPGGEFINGGLALIAVYDTIKGHPRANRAVVLNTLRVTRGNVDAYQREFIDRLPRYDARKLSKARNPSAAEDGLKIVFGPKA